MHEHQHLAGFYFEISLCSSVLLIVAVDLSTWQRYRLMASNECVGLIFRGWIYAPSFDADSLTGPRFLPIKPDLFKRSVLVGDSAAVTNVIALQKTQIYRFGKQTIQFAALQSLELKKNDLEMKMSSLLMKWNVLFTLVLIIVLQPSKMVFFTIFGLK